MAGHGHHVLTCAYSSSAPQRKPRPTPTPEATLRIIHAVSSDNFAGVEQYLCYVAPELARRGHAVTVIGGEPERMRPVLEAHGVAFRPAASPSETAKGLLGATRPDVVHSHMTAADLAAVLTRPLARAQTVSTLHFAKPRGSNPVLRRAWRLLPRAIDAQVAISQFVADHASTPCEVVLNGVPWVAAEPLPEREPIVLVAQRFEVEKDTATALRAWARSGLAAEGWALHFAGRGKQESALHSLARTLGVERSVRFLGHVEDLPRRLSSSSVFLATATAEPFGLAVVEAMAASTPVVASGAGAHLETVGTVEGAVLFPPGDAGECARLLVALAGDERRRREYGTTLAEHHRSELTIERHVDRLEAVYRCIMR